METIPLTVTEFEPEIARTMAPTALAIHQERTFTPAILVEMTAVSSARLASQEPTISISCGDVGRPFALKNLEAP